MGGIGVKVGAGDGVIVMVGVCVTVGVDVAVGIAVGSTTRPEDRRVKKTAVAPMATKSANNPRAAGRVSVNSGMRLPCTVFLADEAGAEVERLVPHTTHLIAFSLTRVPQVGQIFVEGVDFSGLMFVYVSKCAYYTSK